MEEDCHIVSLPPMCGARAATGATQLALTLSFTIMAPVFEMFRKLASEIYLLISMDSRLSVGGRYAPNLDFYEE